MRWTWLLLLLTGCGMLDTLESIGPGLAQGRDQRALVMSFLAFDNDKDDLWNQIPDQLNLLEQTGSATHTLVAQVDGAKPNDGRRYRIHADRSPQVVSPFEPLPEEVVTADPAALTDFLRWGMAQSDATLRLVEIVGHGDGWRGIARDDAAGVRYLPLPALAAALKTAVGRVQVLSLDACGMATLETVAELHGVADYLVASEDSTMLLGLMTGPHLDEILRSPGPEEIAKNLVLKSNRFGKSPDRPNKAGQLATVYTVSALRVNTAPRLVAAWDQLTKRLMTLLPSHKQAIAQAILASRPNFVTHHFGPDDGQRDVFQLLKRIADLVPDRGVQKAVAQVREALSTAIALARRHPSNPLAQGLAVQIRPDFGDYAQLKLARDTQWDELLQAIAR